MPLCPTCICSHLELHIKEGKSSPQFDNINDSFGSLSNEIKVFSNKFEDGQNQLVKLYLFRIQFKEKLYNKRKIYLNSFIKQKFK
jgi:hypothetical protein